MNLDRVIQIVHDQRRFQELPREHYQAIAEATMQAEVEIVTPTSLLSPEQVDRYIRDKMVAKPIIAPALTEAESQALKDEKPGELQPILPAALADLDHHEPTPATAGEAQPAPAQAETVAIEQKPAAPVIGAVVG